MGWSLIMAVDKTLDKYLANIIFTNACVGFGYSSGTKRFQLKVAGITERIFENMADRASAIGRRLTEESVNLLLQWTQKDALCYDEILSPLPVFLLLNGESVRIKFEYQGNAYFADLMKMTESEFLILQTDLVGLKEQRAMQIYPDGNIGNGEPVYVPSCGNVMALQSWILKPLDYHCYAAWHFMQDLWRHEITDNLWHTYNALTDFVSTRVSWENFLKIMAKFNENGLSTFVFRMMLNSL